MARKQITAAETERQRWAERERRARDAVAIEREAHDAAIQAQRDRRDSDRARREQGARVFGDRVQEAVRRTLAGHIEDMRTPARPEPKSRLGRARTWKGPHHGKSFRDAASLERATIEECEAGFGATWGYAITAEDRRVFRIVVLADSTSAAETTARRIYKDLRKAIDAANHFAKTNYNQKPGCAAVALGHLWGHLPTLPLVNKLPGYEKLRPLRRALTESWQNMARRMLGRALSPRELAELSVLLGIGPVRPYAKCFVTPDGKKLQVSPADVLRDEAKQLEKFAEPTAPR